MNAKHLALASLLLVGATARLALAQSSPGYPMSHPAPYPAMYSGYGFYDHASTLEEGMANGVANIMHSAGAANLMHSQALRNYQEAHSRALDNKVKGAQTHMEMTKLRREYAAAQRGPRPTAEQMARYAKGRAPQRLGSNELDPLSGRILWPVVLEDDVFTPHREQLEELVLKWVRYKGRIGPDEYLAMQRSTKALESELKLHVREYPAAEYVKAKNILQGLAFEVERREASLAVGESDDSAGPIASSRKLPDGRTTMMVSTTPE